jgi:hypothetical protein
VTTGNVAIAIILLCVILLLWHAPIFKPWFGFRRPKDHKGKWGE